MAGLAVLWEDARELADLHAQAERLGAPVSRVMQEAWRLARASIRARGDRIEALRAGVASPKPTPAKSPALGCLASPIPSTPPQEPRLWVAWREGDPTF